jgi:hypothetical protein
MDTPKDVYNTGFVGQSLSCKKVGFMDSVGKALLFVRFVRIVCHRLLPHVDIRESVLC